MPDTFLKAGDKAPPFTLKTQKGKEVSLKDFKDKRPVVLIFYPGDMTPGCTIQLCNIRDNWPKFEETDAAVYGVNHADAKSHAKFAEKHQFPFPLLVDEDKKVSKKYGAIKKLFSATVIKRTVAVIDKDGKIVFYKYGMPKETEILKALTKSI
ncbi:redoxin domain-containing protein [Candidatus Uhrbacteria bacterium]|nr:redoxin domain-containing protein [Candidatus Uhrbacteria bacterium]